MKKHSKRKAIVQNILLSLGVFFSLGWVSFLYAADLTSTNFIIRDPVLGTGSGFGSSASFQGISSGNINIQGNSNSASFIGQYGFLYYPGPVEPSITFSLGSNAVSLGTLSPSFTGNNSHTFNVSTNSTGGFSVTTQGQTLTNNLATINPIGNTPTTSSVGTEQFGINLRDNTTPNVGANVTQNSGTCGYGTGFETVDSFKFVSGSQNTIATAPSSADCTYTVSYIANISPITESGSYSTVLDFVATGTF